MTFFVEKDDPAASSLSAAQSLGLGRAERDGILEIEGSSGWRAASCRKLSFGTGETGAVRATEAVGDFRSVGQLVLTGGLARLGLRLLNPCDCSKCGSLRKAPKMGSVVVRQGSGSLLPATPDGRGGRPRCQIRKRWISDRMGSTSVCEENAWVVPGDSCRYRTGRVLCRCPCLASSALGPMPDNSMILGVSNAPAQRMTSLWENAKTGSVIHITTSTPGGRGFRHTLKSADTFNTDDSLAFEK
jgi:hypothetical protein